jgi:hypothetical protein
MSADKSLLHRKWPADSDRRQRHFYDVYVAQEAGLKRRSTISHPRVGRMTLLRLGLPLSSWRASKAHSGDEGSPALSWPQAPPYYAEAYFGFVISSSGCLLSHRHAVFGAV